MKNYLSMSLVLLFVSIGFNALAQKAPKAFYDNPATQVMLKTNVESKVCETAHLWKKQPQKEMAKKLYESFNMGSGWPIGKITKENWQEVNRASSIWLTTRNSKSNPLATMKRGSVVPHLFLGVKCDVHPFKLENLTVAASEIDGDIVWLRLER